MDPSLLQLIIPIAGVVAIAFALYLARDVLSRDTGTQAMQDVAATIFEGAVAFIRRQYTTIGILAIGGFPHPAEPPFRTVGFGFGASFVALFAQLRGGIYTKAADVGSDLVGKVEAGIPEDDPRNAGVIADLVGDNVGDCAGRGADLFESTAAENIGAMILGVAAFAIAQSAGWPNPQAWIFFPLVVRAFGLLATIVAIFFVRGKEDEDPMNMLNRGYWVTTLLSVVGLAITTNLMMQTSGVTGANGVPVWVYF